MTPPSNRDVEPTPTGGYGSAADLPQFKEADRNLRAARQLSLAAGADLREELADLSKNWDRLGETVDGFYSLIGDSGWILLDFNVEDIRRIIVAGDREGLEAYLTQWFSDSTHLSRIVARAKVLPELSGRDALLDLALEDSLAGRHYSAVLVLLAVTDGLISDMDRGNRRGLHARDPDLMVAWGSPVGHRSGLPAALKIYGQHIGKVNEDEVYNLYRHGIVHGMVPHFNNPVVGGKAWALLAALLDWARAEGEAAKPAPVPATFESVALQLALSAKLTSQLKEWSPRSWRRRTQDEQLPSEQVVAAAAELFDAWQHGRWGVVAQRVDPSIPALSEKRFAGEIRDRFSASPIEGWTITAFEFVGPLAADVTCELKVADEFVLSQTKWFYKSAEGKHLNEFETGGVWRCIHDFPDEIFGMFPTTNG